MSRKLKLTTGEDAVVDNSDYDWASMFDWRLHQDGHVVRDGRPGEPNIVYLCNEVMSRANNVPLAIFAPPRLAK